MCDILKIVRLLALAVLVAPALAVLVPATAAEPTSVGQTQAKNYRVRLVAEYAGNVVGTIEIVFSAADDLQFRNAVGDAQRGFAQSLNDAKIKWSRINYYVISVQ